MSSTALNKASERSRWTWFLSTSKAIKGKYDFNHKFLLFSFQPFEQLIAIIKRYEFHISRALEPISVCSVLFRQVCRATTAPDEILQPIQRRSATSIHPYSRSIR
jgi:hypothetical protein